IFFSLPRGAESSQDESVRKKAESILAQARNGSDFGELARKYSEAPEAQDGGVLGYFRRNEMLPELDEVGFKMKPGEISNVIVSSAGFHLLRVMEKKGGVSKPFEEVQAKLREELIQVETEKKYNAWMKELRAKAFVEIRL
ncbi:MAG TPA: peptidylprolyl isomerase, partial [Thermodesulfobacteriota bacterium]|nr:peptidylprolyl isomerase [Thermodesulfobacteriota bacterium]